MITAVVEIFAALIKALVAADGDARREEDAMMAAEEKLSRARAKAKFSAP